MSPALEAAVTTIALTADQAPMPTPLESFDLLLK